MKSIDLISEALAGISDGMVFDYADLNLPAEYLLSAAQTISRIQARLVHNSLKT